MIMMAKVHFTKGLRLFNAKHIVIVWLFSFAISVSGKTYSPNNKYECMSL